MRKWRHLMTMLAVFGTAFAVASYSSMDVVDQSYSTHSELVQAGAIESGWIPPWVPAEATVIQEVHDVDTNESALSFTVPAGAKWRPPSSCRLMHASQFVWPPFDRAWLPKALDGYNVYGCPTDLPEHSGPLNIGVAIGRGGTHVLHWRVFSK